MPTYIIELVLYRLYTWVSKRRGQKEYKHFNPEKYFLPGGKVLCAVEHYGETDGEAI